MWHFLYTVEGSDIVKRIDAWRKTSVKTKDLIIDQSGEGKVVEKVCKVFPNVGIAIFSEALIIEAIDLSDLARFVVSTEDCDSLGVSNFKGNEEGNSFDRVITSINIVTCDPN